MRANCLTIHEVAFDLDTDTDPDPDGVAVELHRAVLRGSGGDFAVGARDIETGQSLP